MNHNELKTMLMSEVKWKAKFDTLRLAVGLWRTRQPMVVNQILAKLRQSI